MSPEERSRMMALAQEIQDERDPKRFTALVEELNQLLDGKRTRLNPEERKPT